MPQPADENKLVVRLERTGRELTNLVSWSISTSYLTSTDGFDFSAYDPNRDNLRDFELEPVELLINDASQLLGRIDQTEIGGTGSALTCRGRDYIADMVECNVDPALKFREGMTLQQAIIQAASPVGITEVLGAEDVRLQNIRTGRSPRSRGTPKRFTVKKISDFKPEPGVGIYEFLNPIVARHGATIQPAAKRNQLQLAAPNYLQAPLYGIVNTDDLIASKRNNVKSAVALRDYSRFPTYAIFTGRDAKGGTSTGGTYLTAGAGAASVAGSLFGPAAQVAAENSSAQTAGSSSAKAQVRYETNFDISKEDVFIPIRRKPGEVSALGLGQLYRLLYLRDEQSRNLEQLTHASSRAIAERVKDALEYTVVLRGHTDPDSGAVWSVDTMVQVDDEICNIHQPLWIAERTLAYSPGEGATTMLKCWSPFAFVI